MSNKMKELVYRGVRYTTDSVNLIKKKHTRKELTYRGVKYIDDFKPKRVGNSTSKKCYRGTCY